MTWLRRGLVLYGFAGLMAGVAAAVVLLGWLTMAAWSCR